ncbi:MAG: putative membrane protein [Candidatus Azotimanducaceae bacterium]|jgi:uncharacterized membrane protein
MTVIIIGVILFFGIHMLPALSAKSMLVDRIGETPYKVGFSLVSLAGLGLMIYGFQLAEFVSLWTPAPWGRSFAMGVMPIALILVIAANVPGNIKRFVRHPMLIGITLWAATHLTANGDLASTILFASFLAFSILDIALVESSGRFKAQEPANIVLDVGVVIGGIILYGVLFSFHGSFTGMPLM